MRLRDPLPNLEKAVNFLNEKPVNPISTPSLVYFWSISCGDCKRRMPEIERIREEFHGRLQLISIHMPLSKADENVEEIERLSRKYKIQEPIIIDNNYYFSTIFGTKFVPSFYLFDGKGRLRHFQATKGLRPLMHRIKKLVLEAETAD